MWCIQAMAANRRTRSSGADDIAEAIHRMLDAMQPPVEAQPRNDDCTSQGTDYGGLLAPQAS